MNVLLVSPNGLHELSGGGLYLRSIAYALCEIHSIKEVTVISKDVRHTNVFRTPTHCRTEYVEKNVGRDVLGRLRLSPTFLITHFDKIWTHAHRADVVLFHNSRCGALLRRMQRRTREKRYGIISDNVEAELKRQHTGANALQQSTNAIETMIIRRAERMSIQADFMTFITRGDRVLFQSLYGVPKETEILPVSLVRGIRSASSNATVNREGIRIIFTAHFGFAPNRRALNDFISVARAFRRICSIPVEFIAAGAQAAAVADNFADITVINSPSPDEMAEVFNSATVYLAPVSWGSGMKTKVAEALSYGLPVICMPNAAEGYEDALANPRFRRAIQIVQTSEAMANALHKLLQSDGLAERHESAYAAFDALYSAEIQSHRLEKLLCPR